MARPGSMGTSPPNPQRVRAMYRAARQSLSREPVPHRGGWLSPAMVVARRFRVSCAEVRRIVQGGR